VAVIPSHEFQAILIFLLLNKVAKAIQPSMGLPSNLIPFDSRYSNPLLQAT
jgi:hypothetical protein